jgi:hypothetical protein
MFGEQCDEGFVGAAVGGRGGEGDLDRSGVDAGLRFYGRRGGRGPIGCTRPGRRWRWWGGTRSCGWLALAEEGGAHADAGAALFDGYGEVVRHANGELREGGVEFLRCVAEAA